MYKILILAGFLLVLSAAVIPTVAADDISSVLLQGEPSIALGQAAKVSFDLLNGHHIVLKTKLAGSDKVYNFVLDTGATVSLISSDIIGEIKATKAGSCSASDATNTNASVDLYKIDMNVGGCCVKNTPVAAYDFGFVNSQSSCRIDGIIGVSFQRFFCLTVDYKNKEITFSTSKSTQTGKYQYKMPSRDVTGIMTLPISVDGKQIDGIIDTGAKFILVNYDFLNKLSYPKEECVRCKGSYLSGVFGSNSDTHDMCVRIKSLDIIGAKLNNYVVQANQGDGAILGYLFLSQFKVTLDYPNNTICLTPYEDASFDSHNMWCPILTLKKLPDGKVAISSLWEGTSLDKLGVNVGDAVTKINGKNASDYSQGQIDALVADMKTELLFTIDSNGKTQTVKVKGEALFPEK